MVCPVTEHRLSSCGAQAQWLHSMWDLPGSGVKPASSALAGKFFTTEAPGKPEFECVFLNALVYSLGQF